MKMTALALMAPAALLAGCAAEPEEKKKEQVKAAPRLTLYEFMTQKVDKDADVIWDVGNKAIDAQSSIDPKLMTDADWATLEDASDRMAADARVLAATDPLIVKPAGVTIADEGTPGAPTTAQIEGHIARDHDLFRALAEALGNHAAELAAAAAKKDHATAGRLINELDGVCESCHLEFWYPEQKAMIEKAGIKLK